MFAERFDALMNIAEVSNSLLGRAVSMNSSHIGRLRSGARPLPKRHEFLLPMCRYLAGHIQKEYQRTALQKLTGIGASAWRTSESTALFLESWLLEKEQDTAEATGRLISGFSRLASRAAALPASETGTEPAQKNAAYLYGSAGKRRAVEQFFLMILQEEKPQTLLLFSDETMAWLYEDAAFAKRWAELFTRVLMKGNRVRIIHTVSRDMNEMLEAVTKWIPIYMTGMIEPYCYPRLRDGVFQRTLFVAPQTAAVVSSSVMKDTDGMLNLFLTDKAAVEALRTEFERYFALCRPLMRIFTAHDTEGFRRAMGTLASAEGDSCLYTAMPPLFAMPEAQAAEIAEQAQSETLLPLWRKSRAAFCRDIQKQRLSLTLLDPKQAILTPEALCPSLAELLVCKGFVYTQAQYEAHLDHLRHLAGVYENLTLRFRTDIAANLLLYVKEDVGAVMAKTDAPMTAFVIGERNMTSAFWDYLAKKSLP